MQKKIIALAIASALVAPAAFAEVTVYGKADLGIGSTSNGTVTNTQLASNVTKFGIKGAEDLGDGLSAVWQIEQQVDINNAGGANSTKNTLASRNSFLGLKSESIGTVLMGRHDTPYKISTRGLDVFGDQFADNRHLMGTVQAAGAANNGTNMDARPANVIAYITPKLSGFTGAAAYAVNTSVATTAAQDKGTIWSLAGMYEQDALYAAIGYEKVGFSNVAGAQFVGTSGDSVKAWKIGAGYTFDAFTINGVYEKITSSIGGIDTLGHKNYNLGGIYKFGNNDVKLSYTVAGNTGATVNTGAKMIGLGFDHNFSKTTSVYAQYNRISNDAGAAYGFNTNATTAAQLGVLGQKTSGYMLGMKHAF